MIALYLWGIGIVLALQAMGSPALDGFFLAVTQLGGEEFVLLLVPLVYWCLDKRFGIRLAYVFLFSSLINIWLKAMFNTPRPFQYDSRVRLIGPEETNPGFPSGHAQSVTTVWGMLAVRARRGGVWALAIVLIAFVALSRMYLGVHFPHDVIGGVVYGAIVLLIFTGIEPLVSPRFAALSTGAQIALALVAPLALLIVFLSRDSVSAAAVLSGMSIGFVMQRRWANFSVSGSNGQRALRFILGMVGVFALYFGLRIAFGALAREEETALWYVLRFVRYALVGVWAGGLWPMMAVRLKLAAKAEG